MNENENNASKSSTSKKAIIIIAIVAVIIAAVLIVRGITAYAIQTNNIDGITNEMTTAQKVKKAYETYFEQETEEEDKKPKSLVEQGIKVGDYVNYNATSGQGAGRSYTVDTSKSGSTGEAEVFNSSDITTWRVFSIKSGQIELMAERPTSQTLKLRGSSGYINAKSILNGIADIYGHGNGAVGARSINIEDVDQYFKYDKTTYTSGNYTYGDTQEYTSGQFIINGEIVQAPQTMTQTSYAYNASKYKYEETENVEANTAYKMLFETINTYPERYWLATCGTTLSVNHCSFGIANVVAGRNIW